MAEYNPLKLVDNCLILDLGKYKGCANLTPLLTGSGGGVWGTITGTLSAQTDLQTALNLKANTSALSDYGLKAGTQTWTGVNTFTPPASTLSTGTVSLLNITPTITQTGSAGYTAFKLNVTETTIGSGAKLLADFQVGGVSKFKVDNTGYATFASDVNTPQFYRIGGVAIHTVIGSNLYHYAGGNGHIFVDGFGGTTLAQINAGGRFMLGNFTDNGVDILQITGTSKFTGAVNIAGNLTPDNNSRNLGSNSARWVNAYMNGPIEWYGGNYRVTPDYIQCPSGTAISTTQSSANASAQLDVQSTTKGFKPPSMTTAQKNAITSPVGGLIVYDTDLGKLCIRGASAWEVITSS